MDKEYTAHYKASFFPPIVVASGYSGYMVALGCFWFCWVWWLWLPWVSLLEREFCCLLVDHHSRSLSVFSWRQFCCYLGCPSSSRNSTNKQTNIHWSNSSRTPEEITKLTSRRHPQRTTTMGDQHKKYSRPKKEHWRQQKPANQTKPNATTCNPNTITKLTRGN
jgi:hypothetical protein